MKYDIKKSETYELLTAIVKKVLAYCDVEIEEKDRTKVFAFYKRGMLVCTVDALHSDERKHYESNRADIAAFEAVAEDIGLSDFIQSLKSVDALKFSEHSLRYTLYDLYDYAKSLAQG